MNKLITKYVKLYTNRVGWKTDKKIVVFESDDWGAIRMPNKIVYDKLIKTNDKLVDDNYSKFDGIARTDDLEILFEVLSKHKDKNENNPVITANTIVANPDFEKIRKSNFTNYEFETFDKTIEKLQDGHNILKLWNEGIKSKIFKPQLHGREHLNVPLWMEELKLGNKDLLDAFEEGCFGVPYIPLLNNKRRNVMAALDYVGINGEIEFKNNYIEEAVQIFEDYFGFKSKSFIATAYIWNSSIEVKLKDGGIEYLQGLPIQYSPSQKENTFKKKLHYIGQKNKNNQIYLTRNAFFEPSTGENHEYLTTLKSIEQAFKYRKPAIIGTHRINFIGSMVENNRDKNIRQFNNLLKEIISKWPDVEFMTSDQLGDSILNYKCDKL